ncbi:MAG: riboflavin biosynthesis protein RibF [Clostridia bacterium]|nr:riboflavin biosynthesis protein RibF [Clostridia bacterium]
MLEIVKYNEDEYAFPCLLVLGCFDGLHTGHAELLKKAKLQAKINGLDLGVMMFADGKGGKQLYSFEERISFLEGYNVKFVLKIDFNDAFKQIKPLEFLNCIEEKLNVKAYMSGKDFKFGQGKKGKASTLKSYAEDEENGVWYMPVKDVVYGEEKVSTTLVKTMLENGDVKCANELLGRNYSVSGTVVHGADRGAKLLGYPTMNITYPDYKFEVKQGVYKVKCIISESEYYGIANYGARPTFGEDKPLLEVFLNGFGGENYDQTVTVEFLHYIRDIQKFETPEQLAVQLSKDLHSLDAETELAVTEDINESASDINSTQEVSIIEESPVEDQTAETAPEITEKQSAEQPVNIIQEEQSAQEACNEEVQLDAVSDEFEEELNEPVAEEIKEAIEDTEAVEETALQSSEDNADVSEEILEENNTAEQSAEEETSD